MVQLHAFPWIKSCFSQSFEIGDASQIYCFEISYDNASPAMIVLATILQECRKSFGESARKPSDYRQWLGVHADIDWSSEDLIICNWRLQNDSPPSP
jgi:hypothetical protein